MRAGITYLTSKCPAGAGSPFRILFHDRTLNHDASVALNDTVSCVLVEYAFFLSGRPSLFSLASPWSAISLMAETRGCGIPTRMRSMRYFANEISGFPKGSTRSSRYFEQTYKHGLKLRDSLYESRNSDRSRSARFVLHRFERVPLVKRRQI